MLFRSVWVMLGEIGKFDLHLGDSCKSVTLFTLTAQPTLISKVIEAQRRDRDVYALRFLMGKKRKV